jgi:exopolyphosphatase
VPTGVLAARFGRNRIIGCIDHHDNEGGEYLEVGDEQPVIIRKSGSCMSLVVEYVTGIWKRQIRAEDDGYRDPLDLAVDAVNGQDEVQSQRLESESQTRGWGDKSHATGLQDGISARRLGAQLAYLAIAPIVVDTANMTDVHKVTPTDSESLQFLSMIAVAAGVDYTGGTLKGPLDKDGYYEELARLKSSVSGLSYRDVFRKDYKDWEEAGARLGISSTVSLGRLLREVGDEKALLNGLHAWAQDKNLDIVAVMTAFKEDGRFQRELLIWALDKRAANVIRRFVEQEKERLGLESWQNGKLDDTQTDRYRRVWTQQKLENSRKQVAPMLREAMRA